MLLECFGIVEYFMHDAFFLCSSKIFIIVINLRIRTDFSSFAYKTDIRRTHSTHVYSFVNFFFFFVKIIKLDQWNVSFIIQRFNVSFNIFVFPNKF